MQFIVIEVEWSVLWPGAVVSVRAARTEEVWSEGGLETGGKYQ